MQRVTEAGATSQSCFHSRPKGRKSKRRKLTGKDEEIQRLLAKKISVSASSRLPGGQRLPVAAHSKQQMQ